MPWPLVVAAPAFEPKYELKRLEVLPDRILLYVSDGDAAVAAVHGRGLAPSSVLVRRSTLEDVFLHLTGRTLVD